MTAKEKICGKCGKPITQADEDNDAVKKIDNEDGTFTWVHLYGCTLKEKSVEARDDCRGEN
jgi:hypothetical protein